jgi:hypothetical protein
MPSASRSACNQVSAVLWRERDLLDKLAFTLEVQRVMLVPGHDRWLPRACREVELSLLRLRSVELERAVRVDALAGELGLRPAPSLGQVAEAVVEPWAEIFTRHRLAFLETTGEIARLARANRLELEDGRPGPCGGAGWLSAGPSGDGRVAPDAVHPLLREAP